MEIRSVQKKTAFFVKQASENRGKRIVYISSVKNLMLHLLEVAVKLCKAALSCRSGSDILDIASEDSHSGRTLYINTSDHKVQ